jgi:hypothetical protein
MLLERARQCLHASITDLVLAHDEPKFARRGWSQWTSMGTRHFLLQGQARQHRGTEAAADENLHRLHVAQFHDRPGSEAGIAEPGIDDAACVAAGFVKDQGLRGELARADGAIDR